MAKHRDCPTKKAYKWKKFYASRSEHKTTQARERRRGTASGGCRLGKVSAQRAVERQHGIKINLDSEDWKLETRGGNWVFCQRMV